MRFDQHHHHPPQVKKETFSLRMTSIWSLTHIYAHIVWSPSSSILGHPSGAASSKIVYLMISSGAITPGTARYLSAEWSCIESWCYLQNCTTPYINRADWPPMFIGQWIMPTIIMITLTTWSTWRWESTETLTRVGMKCSSGAQVSENHSWMRTTLDVSENHKWMKMLKHCF